MSKGYFVKDGVAEYYGTRTDKPQLEATHNWVDEGDPTSQALSVAMSTAPVKTREQLMVIDYNKAGVTTNKMIIALYEKIVEGKDDDETGINDMQIKRAIVKSDHPKG